MPPADHPAGPEGAEGAEPTVTVYELVGGRPFFDRLVEHFYAGVESDPVLRPLYPEDLTESRRHLAAFLAQYWGGPPEYSAERGHPRLRMRHLPFAIGTREAEAWLAHMRAAVDALGPEPAVTRLLDAYFTDAAHFLRNVDEETAPGA
ncbi:MAG: globin [Actinomyces sp.]|nr:MAG: globin [Actinomyces sp.]